MNTLIHWTPVRGLNTLQEQVNRAFDEAFSGNRTAQGELATWSPAVDVYETENELVIKADLPDVKKDDIDIRVEKNMLTIRGERKFEKSVSEDHYLRVERAFGTFARSFSLPNTINAEGIDANYQDGVLTLHLPKREESKPKQIKIGVGSAKAGSEKTLEGKEPKSEKSAGKAA